MVKSFNTTSVTPSKSGGFGIGTIVVILAILGVGYMAYTSYKKNKEENKEKE